MRWFLWTLIAWDALIIVLAASQVGKPRKPLEASTFAIMVLINALMIAGLLVTLDRGLSS